jgi:hypothetical protein
MKDPESPGPARREEPTMTSRWKVNITPTERAARVLVGAIGAILGAFLLGSASSATAVVLELLLVAAGLDLVVTGAVGHCPLYAKLGHVPASLKEKVS